MQGRVDQADDDRVAVHGLEQAVEILALDTAAVRSAASVRSALVSARIMRCTIGRRSGLEEHVLGAAQADALGAVGAGPAGILAGNPHWPTPADHGVRPAGGSLRMSVPGGDLVRPVEQGQQVGLFFQGGRDGRDLAQ